MLLTCLPLLGTQTRAPPSDTIVLGWLLYGYSDVCFINHWHQVMRIHSKAIAWIKCLIFFMFFCIKGFNARAPWSPDPTSWSTPTQSAHASTPASSQTGPAPSWAAKCRWTPPHDAPRPESVPAAAAARQTDQFPPSEPSTENNT